MKELHPTPKPNRLLVPTIGERSEAINHFIPFKSRDEERVKHLKAVRRGTRIREDEQAGVTIVKRMLEQADSPEVAAEIGRYGAIAVFGASQYLLTPLNRIGRPAKPRVVQNRYIQLPRLSPPNGERRPNTEQLRDNAIECADYAIRATQRLTNAHLEKVPYQQMERLRHHTGWALGRYATHLSAIGIGDQIHQTGAWVSDNKIQLLGRDTALEALKGLQDVSAETNTYASVAQLTEPLSPFAVEMQKAASDRVLEIYHDVLAA